MTTIRSLAALALACLMGYAASGCSADPGPETAATSTATAAASSSSVVLLSTAQVCAKLKNEILVQDEQTHLVETLAELIKTRAAKDNVKSFLYVREASLTLEHLAEDVETLAAQAQEAAMKQDLLLTADRLSKATNMPRIEQIDTDAEAADFVKQWTEWTEPALRRCTGS